MFRDICFDGDHLQQELSFLFAAFEGVGFPIRVLREVHSSVKKKFHTRGVVEDPVEEPRPPTIALPSTTFVEKHVKPLFKANGSRVVTTSKSTLKNQLVSNRPPNSEEGGVVYRVPCVECDKVYIGQTGRDFAVRLKEHKSAVRLGNMNNACTKHAYSLNHSIDWENACSVYNSNSLSKRLVVESALINTYQNFNNMQSSVTIENLAAYTIIKANRGLRPPD